MVCARHSERGPGGEKPWFPISCSLGVPQKSNRLLVMLVAGHPRSPETRKS